MKPERFGFSLACLQRFSTHLQRGWSLFTIQESTWLGDERYRCTVIFVLWRCWHRHMFCCGVGGCEAQFWRCILHTCSSMEYMKTESVRHYPHLWRKKEFLIGWIMTISTRAIVYRLRHTWVEGIRGSRERVLWLYFSFSPPVEKCNDWLVNVVPDNGAPEWRDWYIGLGRSATPYGLLCSLLDHLLLVIGCPLIVELESSSDVLSSHNSSNNDM